MTVSCMRRGCEVEQGETMSKENSAKEFTISS